MTASPSYLQPVVSFNQDENDFANSSMTNPNGPFGDYSASDCEQLVYPSRDFILDLLVDFNAKQSSKFSPEHLYVFITMLT